jgi:antiviral helicase SLH1
MSYVAQNAGRIIRALLEIAISRKWAKSSSVLISLSKSIEKRLWQYQHPLLQFSVRPEVLYNVERWADDLSFSDMVQMSAEELGQLIHMNVHHGAAVLKLAKEFPSLSLTYDLRPLTSDLLRVVVHVSPSFVWTSRREQATEPFWLWLEDPGGQRILQLSRFLVRATTKSMDIDFVIQLTPDSMEKGLVLRYISDRWLNAEDEVFISLGELVIPSQFNEYTTVLNLPFLSLDVLKHDALKWAFSNRGIHNLNALQTHAIWSVCNASQNALLCAPSGSGKSTLVMMLLGYVSINSSYFPR